MINEFLSFEVQKINVNQLGSSLEKESKGKKREKEISSL